MIILSPTTEKKINEYSSNNENIPVGLLPVQFPLIEESVSENEENDPKIGHL